MVTVKAIIDVLAGGIAGLKHKPIRVDLDGMMPLCIEHIGTGPRGFPLLSVAHYYEQNGDLMRDPDIEIEYNADADVWLPVSFRNDGLGIMQEVVTQSGGGVRVNQKLALQLKLFIDMWDNNIRQQGYLDVAKKM